MMQEVRELGLRCPDTQANFCWVHLGEEREEAEVMQGLAERGVIVRAGSDLGAEDPVLRVSCGLPEENARFLQALTEVLGLVRTP